ncbi:ECF RNA polymerase sigma-E factor [Planctomycetes bacterium Poly30]|uniref:ECF RNA polymerase sigma-E factor n=2 Tax=Saltatorellus ferox TaxID=2528018 RepID=A0A518ETM7_9BACT|nr:ECF RNA polymerase sigma-E factor [Planctomycetes bacterium Poly30]
MDAHADAVFEFVLYRVGRRRDLAEDIAQETLLAAVQGLERFDGRAALRTWLFGIAKNKIREARRSQARTRPLGDILLDADDEIFATLGRIAEEPIPDEILERKETQAMVGATLSSLPESYRTALTERYVEGHSVPETARLQGRGVKAAESTLHRARRAFAEVFTLLNVRAAGEEEGV